MTEKESSKNYLKNIIGIILILCILTALYFVFFAKQTNEQGKDKQPNILLISIDTLRPDYLSTYGYKNHNTRHIDRLASQGVVFDSAYCDVTWTTPSMASTLTGTFAYKHGLRSMYHNLPDSAQTIAESLKTAGYHTAAVIGAFPLDSVYRLDQGFDVYDDSFSGPIYVGAKNPPQEIPSKWGETIKQRKQLFFTKILNKSRRSDKEVTTAAVTILKGFAKNNRPFFLWVHYFGPHAVPDVRRNRLENWKNHAANYPAKVLNTDKEIGNLLAALDSYQLSPNTLVILHADHGESLWEHGFVGHGVYLYEDNLRIPLLMRWPGRIPAGLRLSQLVGNVDIAATILEAAGIPAQADKHMDGKSLFPVIHKGEPLHDSLYFETYLCAHDTHAEIVEIEKGKAIRVGIRSFGLIKKPWKYVKTEFFPLFDAPLAPETFNKTTAKKIQEQVEKNQLFNLTQDPGELHSMARTPTGNTMMQELKHLLLKYLEMDKIPGKNRLKLSDEQLEKLRSLGYID